jgi:F-type H+-transporting ATPase subunit b
MLSIFAAEGPNGLQLASDINEVIWGSLAFFVLLALVVWKAGPAIKAAISGRTDRIRDELAAAEAERADAEAALSAKAADVPDVDVEQARIREEAQETAERLKTDMAAKAQADAAALVARAQADVATQRAQALADMREEVARLTRDATEAVVNDSLDDASQSDLIDQYISQVGQS